MSDAQNRAVIEDYYRALGEGDFPHVVELHSPDLVCWMSGTSLVSGQFKGRDALYAHMGEHVLGALITGTEPYVKESLLAIVDSPIVVGLLHGGLPTKDGGRYDQFYLQIFRLQDGLIVEIVELFDTVMVETALMKNALKVFRPPRQQPFNIAVDASASHSTRAEVVAVTGQLLRSLGNRNTKQLRAVVSPLVRTRIIGSTLLSGISDGIEALIAVFDRGVQGARLMCADSAASCILLRSSDAAYDQQYGLLVRVSKQQVIDVSIFLDTVEVEKTAFGNPVLPMPSRRMMPPFDIQQAHLTIPIASTLR